jgi:ribosomal-protein-alanine N-acetyltransferase
MKNTIKYPSIETVRTNLRELTIENREEVFQHFSDTEITEFMDIEPCKDLKEAGEIINFHTADSGCRWGVFLKENNKLIGTCGFHCLDIMNKYKAEIGFDLSKEYWGRGLMTEALMPIIKYAFERMNLEFIEATVEQENVRCQKLLERIRFIKSNDLRDNLFYYSLTKESYFKYLKDGSYSV